MPIETTYPETSWGTAPYPLKIWHCPKCKWNIELSFNHKPSRNPFAFQEAELHIKEHVLDE